MESQLNQRISELEKNNHLEIAMQEFQEGNFLKAVEMYRKAIEQDPELIKQGIGINYSHTMILATDWEEISRNLPSGINYLESSGWLNSLWAGKPLNQSFSAIPWYTYPAIEFLENKIDQSWKIFEFGSGQSTLWWSEKVAEVISLESDKDWYSYIQANMPNNVSLCLEEDETEYATKISDYPDHYFDIIIIDGVNRNNCAKFALNKVKDKGFIIFDNTDNYEFDLGVNLLLDNGYHKIDFYGLIPGYTYKNCTSIFFKDFAILSDRKLPSKKQSCLGLSCFQITNPESK